MSNKRKQYGADFKAKVALRKPEKIRAPRLIEFY
jgi:hypothetical protein